MRLPIKLSLIMATLGRISEVECFLAALDKQTHNCFELIVVDQNPDDCLVPMLGPGRTRFPVMHLRSEPGVSRARNIGLEYATGEVVGFPDDDCWYEADFLERIALFLREHPEIDGVTGRAVDGEGASYARFHSSEGDLNLYNAWQRSVTFCTFLRSYVIERIGGFDETLGPGANTIWGGGEDIDYPLRAIEAGFRLHYDPDLVAFHPNPLRRGYEEMAARAYAYGAGIGRVWRKHDYPIWLVAYYLLRPIGGTLLSLVMGRKDKTRYHWSAFRGRLKGWLSRG